MDAASAWDAVGGSAAVVYQRQLVPGMFAPWAPLLADLVDVQPGEVCVDVACGTGVVARVLAARVGAEGRVYGVDINAEMLTVARLVPTTAQIDIRWTTADALEMPFPDDTIDVVTSQHGLQQMASRPRALEEMLRVLRPGGRLGIIVWSDLTGSPGMDALVAALGQLVGHEAAANRRRPFSLSDADALRGLITQAGFVDVRLDTRSVQTGFVSAEQLVTAQLTATPLTTLGRIDAATHAAIVAHVRAALVPWTIDGVLRVPMAAHLALARKAA